jgi:hypothetical protein
MKYVHVVQCPVPKEWHPRKVLLGKTWAEIIDQGLKVYEEEKEKEKNKKE